MHSARRFLLSLFLFLVLTDKIGAQSIFESDDFAGIDDSFLVSSISILDISDFDYSIAGADTTWDYSAFVPVSQAFQRYVDPDRTGFRTSYILTCNATCIPACYDDCINSGQLPFICSGYCNLDCGSTCLSNWFTKFDLAKLSNDSINLLIIALRDMYNFYDISQTALSQVALGAKLAGAGSPIGIPVIMEYQNADRIHVFPMEYGDKDTSVSNYFLQIDSIPGTGIPIGINYRHGQKRYNHIEGWGTLKTPYGVFDSVLKVKSEIYNEDTVIFQNDTFTLSEFLPNQVLPERVVEYKWFSPDFGIPLLEVSAFVFNGNLVYQDLKYIDSLRCFDPFPLFGYLPIPAVLNDGDDSLEVNFYSLAVNGDSLYWNFDDDSSANNTAFGANPSHYYSEGGVYNVQFVACNRACPNFICDTFTLPVLVIDVRQPNDTTSVAFLPSEGGKVIFYPNPFNETVTAQITSAADHDLKMNLFDITGRKLANITEGKTSGGNQTLNMDFSDLPDGMYIVQINYGTSTAFCKLLKQQ